MANWLESIKAGCHNDFTLLYLATLTLTGNQSESWKQGNKPWLFVTIPDILHKKVQSESFLPFPVCSVSFVVQGFRLFFFQTINSSRDWAIRTFNFFKTAVWLSFFGPNPTTLQKACFQDFLLSGLSIRVMYGRVNSTVFLQPIDFVQNGITRKRKSLTILVELSNRVWRMYFTGLKPNLNKIVADTTNIPQMAHYKNTIKTIRRYWMVTLSLCAQRRQLETDRYSSVWG